MIRKIQSSFAPLSGLYPNTEIQIMKARLLTLFYTDGSHITGKSNYERPAADTESVCLPWPSRWREAHWMMTRKSCPLSIKSWAGRIKVHCPRVTAESLLNQAQPKNGILTVQMLAINNWHTTQQGESPHLSQPLPSLSLSESWHLLRHWESLAILASCC